MNRSLLFLLGLLSAGNVRAETFDVIVYGGTAGGVAAAVQVQRMGKRALLIEPGRHLGGLTSGGLGATDIGNKGAIGGISREFYRRVKQHYQQDGAWRQERREQYRSPRQAAGEDTMWTFEPHVAEQILREMAREAGVTVLFEQRLDLKQGVQKQAGRIASIRLEGGKQYSARVYLDASYEGDLLALAGVRFHVGREANALYRETLNGVQTRNAVHHQMVKGVDPWRTPGDKESGLLPGVHAGPPGEEGAGDHRVQAYNFRMCLTDVAENRRPWEKPEGYDPLRYELLLRNFEAGETRTPWSLILMPNRKTDINNNYGFSTDNIGMNYTYPTADYAAREQIFQEHLRYQQGLMWTLAHDPRVPEKIRQEVGRWGNCRDEFKDTGGWPHQLYVREARRMIGEVVMTQHHCQGQETASQPVGLAAYTMDSHNVQRYVDAQGQVRNEGDVQVGGFPPYPIAYGALVPKRDECVNLLVPVCLSASHIAYGSIRMEPVFMVLGQSAATAACLAIDESCPVQQVNYERLRQRLLADKQVLEWTGPRPATVRRVDPNRLPGIVLDDDQLVKQGDWIASSSAGGFVGPVYWHDDNSGQGEKEATFRATLPQGGTYEVRFSYSPHANRATNVPVTVLHARGSTTVQVNQRQKPPLDDTFISLGVFSFAAGADQPVVTVRTSGADGYVIVDAVQMIPK